MAKRIRISDTILTPEAWREIMNSSAEDVDVARCTTSPSTPNPNKPLIRDNLPKEEQ